MPAASSLEKDLSDEPSSAAAGEEDERYGVKPVLPQPHRCNDRVEDVIESLYTLEFKSKIKPAWSNMRACFKSEKGQEPQMPYLVITDGKQYLEPRIRKEPPKNFAK